VAAVDRRRDAERRLHLAQVLDVLRVDDEAVRARMLDPLDAAAAVGILVDGELRLQRRRGEGGDGPGDEGGGPGEGEAKPVTAGGHRSSGGWGCGLRR
jgi:hypothetical protein